MRTNVLNYKSGGSTLKTLNNYIECKELPKGIKIKIGENVYIGVGPGLTPDIELLPMVETTIQ